MRRGGSRFRLRAALFLGVGLGLTGIALIGYGTNVFRELELDSVDARFSIRGNETPPEDIVLVQLDDESFTAIGLNKIPRDYHASVIDRLADDGARVIAYDFQFTEESDDAAADNALIEAVERAGRIALATTLVDEEGNTNIFGGNIPPRARPGNANFSPDPAAVIRRLPHSVNKLKTFAVVAAEMARGKPVPAGDFGGTDVWIDYDGPPGTFQTVPFSWVSRSQTPIGFFRDKIVVVGASATTEHDLHPTPVGENMSGAEVQANAIATVLNGLPLRSAPRWLNVLLIVLLGMLAPLVSLVSPLRWTLAAATVAGAAYVVLTQVAFENGLVLSFVYPFGALIAATVGSIGAHYLLAAFERERVRSVFSRFVPDTVVEQVLARTDDDLRLGGEELYGTVMFTDLRGFTSFAETLPARKVIDILNVYLGEMSEAILENGGTLVAYMGDGIFAVFGAPIEQPDHADRALATAREMLSVRLPRFNAFLRTQGGEGFRMGIGLMTGPFMSGNVGSERRLEYTAIGDTTNTASRIEGMTKGTPYMCLISDPTREALTLEADDLVFFDEVEIRGRQSKVKLWALPDPEVPGDAEQVETERGALA